MLKQLTVSNFRNITKANFVFHPSLSIIIGPNAVGKTNLLEAIYFVLNTKGFRDEKQDELISWQQNLASLKATIETNNDKIALAIFLEKKISVTKILKVNQTKKILKTYLEYSLPVVIFSPQLLNIIEGGPDRRRRYINNIISLYDHNYLTNLTAYEKGLRQRNRLLEQNIDIFQLQKQLKFWDDLLIKHGSYLINSRQQLVKFLNQNNQLDDITFNVGYKVSAITQQTLHDSWRYQMAIRTTVVGPHRDDFEIFKFKNDRLVSLHSFGSRSEERLALFWLANCQLKLFDILIKKKPILLLDDIFSELDIKNKSLIIDLIKNYQTILTTTESDLISSIKLPHSVIKL